MATWFVNGQYVGSIGKILQNHSSVMKFLKLEFFVKSGELMI